MSDVSYQVEIRRAPGGWRLKVLDLDWTPIKGLSDAPLTAQTLIAAAEHVSSESIELEYAWPADIVEAIEAAERHRADAQRSTAAAIAVRRALAQRLRDQGETLASIGVVLGVTRARVNEILNGRP